MLVTDMATEMYWNLDAPAPVDPDSALDTLCIIKYSIDGTTRQTAIHNQSELDRLLYALLDESKKSPCSLFQSNHSSAAAPLSAVKELPVVKFSSADVNKDGKLDAVDASYILTYSTMKGTGKTVTFEELTAEDA